MRIFSGRSATSKCTKTTPGAYHLLVSEASICVLRSRPGAIPGAYCLLATKRVSVASKCTRVTPGAYCLLASEPSTCCFEVYKGDTGGLPSFGEQSGHLCAPKWTNM